MTDDQNVEMDPEYVDDIWNWIINEDKFKYLEKITKKWVTERCDTLIKKNYRKSVDWMAVAVTRSSELDPLTEDERMVLYVIASELVLVYDELAMIMSLDDTTQEYDEAEQTSRLVNWVRALVTLGFVLAKEYPDEFKSVPEKS